MVIKDVLSEARVLLKNTNVDSREARLLLAYSMGISTNDLIKFDSCTIEQYHKFITYINKRISGEPFAYIVGYKEFMKLKFLVNEDVLIPREDTEVLVSEAIHTNKKRILDMCTGSGCIAISLAKYIENSNVDAVDISRNALKVAEKNAFLNDVDVGFIESNLFENVHKKYDLIVSNPPYIRSGEIIDLQIEVKKEPIEALDGGEDGLYFYRVISKEAIEHLNDNGILMFEIGYDEALDVENILKDFNYKDIKVIRDLNGNDRVVVAIKGE